MAIALRELRINDAHLCESGSRLYPVGMSGSIAVWGPAVLSGLIGSVVATLASIWWQRRQFRQMVKLDCLRRVVGLRSVPPSSEWVAALNEVAISFNDSSSVMAALRTYERTIRATNRQNADELVDLIKAMMIELHLSLGLLDDQFLLRPFAAGKEPT